MIITSTPMRISFVGGGSDLPSFYRQYGGAVVCTTINKFVYITINKKFDNKVRASYSITEEVEHSSQVQHRLIKACLEHMNVHQGIEISSMADIPSKGSGLGSSSSFTAGLLLALHAYKHEYISKEALSQETCYIELGKCNEPIGKQDQYAACHGGFNYVKFNKDDTVDVDPVILAPEEKQTLAKRLMLFYTGITRSASAILEKQSTELASNERKVQTMQKMVTLAHDLYADLNRGHIESFGSFLHENWVLKETLADGISNAEISGYYNAALKAGATGGKLLGAGGGGFLLFYVPEAKQDRVRNALSQLRQIDFQFVNSGSKVIFYNF